MTRTRALIHLVPRPGADLSPALTAAATEGVTFLARDPACFMGDRSPQTAAVEASDPEQLVEVAAALQSLLDPDQSMAIVGADHVFIEPPAPSPVRYQYLMHRRADFTHEQYLERYRTVHYEFGMRTPHISGYVQLHVDLGASAALADSTGLHAAPCDSMSELHIESVPHFVEGIVAHPEVGAEAQEDEERFVDREVSRGFAHRLVAAGW